MEKISKAYEYWNYDDRMAFNPDGTMQEWLKKKYIEKGKLFEVFRQEAEMKKNIEEFEEREQRFLKEIGITYSEWESSGREKLTAKQQRARQQAALRSGEPLDSMPYYIDPDDYYDYHSDLRNQ